MALTGKVVREVQTAKDEKSPQEKTILTVDFTDLTDEAAQAFIVSAVTIRLQNKWRKKGIPKEHTVLLKDLAVATRTVAVTAEGVIATAKALTPAERQAAIKALQEMEAAEAAAAKAAADAAKQKK